MFEKLSDRLERSFKLLKGQGRITEINVAETLKDVRRALIDIFTISSLGLMALITFWPRAFCFTGSVKVLATL